LAAGIVQHTVLSYDRLVESFDAFAELSLVAYPGELRNLSEHLPFLNTGCGTRLADAQLGSSLQRSGMLATILIVVMILLQTGALSLGLMVGRRFITEAASLNRKSAHSTIHNRERH
jgi:hypothetical protein